MKTTLVTGLWDIKRDTLSEGWNRSFDFYIEKFKQLLLVDENFIIYGDDELEKIVWSVRKKENTIFLKRNLEWFKKNNYYDLIQKIRTNSEWYNQENWLSESTQSKLEMYNPIVMSKMFLLHDAKILDGFNSDYMFWVDAGITNTVHQGYFTKDLVIKKLPTIIKNFSFICFPYKANKEIHGFKYPEINRYAGKNITKVARGGFFGGHKDTISEMNSIYYNLLIETLNDGYMGTEESIFSIMVEKHSDIINHFMINENGLINKFFEDVKNNKTEIFGSSKNKLDVNKTSLYVITFNSPKQFKMLLNSMNEYDVNFLKKTRKILLDNSSDLTTTPEYQKICEEFNFEHVKIDNLGICGGRQWIAEHFDNSDSDYMLFFEDDMFFYNKKGSVCKNGFNRYVDSLFDKSLSIINKHDFDFLKLNYTEFFGDNGTQWAWYNVPQNIREKYWPEYPTLPKMGLDKNSPRTLFKNFYTMNGITYTTGEIYYCNWPQIVSRTGNKKMFLETKWVRPHEQTWMSHMYQMVKTGELNPALLLLTPTDHNRFDFYKGNLRKES